ncbi:polymerase delta-interacting protein 3 [Agrilus planipennis]|uniref:Polymerase delta-interacting protein 3 n=1 Tax=Agrilus planipennis TaxID=224129 RepID=A0A1W4WNS7_AGRPL|nr:polymerase delta-interacting protein 3 [Agrilus planipennis]
MANKLGNKNFKQRNGTAKTGGIKRRLANRPNIKTNVTDARQKLIQKKRKNVKDAREVLSNLAKKHDARDRLEKLRETRGVVQTNSRVRAIGANIVQTTDKNGKIALVTKKSKRTVSDISLAIKQQLGMLPSRKKIGSAKRSPPKSPINKLSKNVPPTIRKTILNDIKYNPDPIHISYDDYQRGYGTPEDLYKWIRPTSRSLNSEMMSERMRYTRHNNPDWPYLPPSSRMPIAPTAYIDLDKPDEDEEMPLVPYSPVSNTSFRASILSRLDSNPPQHQSHGIFANQTKTKVVVPAGHRIVVSNLQQTVTQDDIRELFEDIGQLLVARLVRPGTAEVIYKNLRDAQKAVDTYHNRQLDGQPMKCFLVNKRPLNNPTGSAVQNQELTSPTTKRTTMSKTSAEKVVPDIQTIHKVLFRRGD